jgi:succinate dehydrogenase / fumarate reductase flavoprotein subunit
MLDSSSSTASARGIIVRDMVTGEVESHAADAVLLATGGYGNVFYLSTNAKGCNVTAIWRAHKRARRSRTPASRRSTRPASPSRRPSVEADADVEVAPQRRPRVGARREGDRRSPDQIPEAERDYYLERKYPSFGNLVPARHRVARGEGGLRRRARRRPRAGAASTSTSPTRSADRRRSAIEVRQPVRDVRAHHRRGPVRGPMRIYPAVHYTMGGLWVDYNLMSTIPGLFVLGEANFSDHGANRLGASALMQGLADGYFVIPYTIGDYLAGEQARRGDDRPPRVQGGARGGDERAPAAPRSRASARSTRSTASSGKIMWDKCGMARTRQGLKKALTRSRSSARSSGAT